MRRAYTLIEILIVIGIVAILTGLASLSIVSYGKSSETQTSKAVVVGILSEARANSMAVLDDRAWGVHFETDRVIIFADSGSGFNPSDPTNQTRTLGNGSASWNLSGGGADILFAKRTAKTANSGEITLSGQTFGTAIITVNTEGGINY